MSFIPQTIHANEVSSHAVVMLKHVHIIYISSQAETFMSFWSLFPVFLPSFRITLSSRTSLKVSIYLLTR